ncbi:MAG: hypothetical protein IJ061_07025 [Lachnospiraceae bacterium]|nr:hypothetical protein [Lachnospiraceae bacterium]
MGLFSKLFGGNSELKSALESAAKEALSGAEKTMGNLADAAGDLSSVIRKEGLFQNSPDDAASGAGQSGSTAAFGSSDGTTAPSGWSWGEVMPAEENQFNYPGTYVEYFDHVFRTEFPEYRITCEQAKYYNATIFIFWNGPQRALVVELLPQHSAAQKLRRDCRTSGIPYLRFYYDHEGWWNTYSYVKDRTRDALRG